MDTHSLTCQMLRRRYFARHFKAPTQQDTTNLDTLPEELLQSIVYHTWAQDAQSFLSLIRANRKLHRIGIQLLYTHVCVGRHIALDTPSWLLALMDVQLAHHSIRSLTFTNIAAISSKSHTWLVSFLRTLSEFSGLKTFSINNTLKHDPAFLDGEAVSFTIREVLLALPPAVINLELSIDKMPRWTQYQTLCYTVGSILPRLETLQLRLPFLCDAFLHSIHDLQAESPQIMNAKLRYASIWLNGRTSTCTNKVGDQRVLGNAPDRRFPKRASDPPYMEQGFFHASLIARSIQKVIQAGRLPQLQRFTVLQDAHPRHQKRKDKAWQIREVVSNHTLTVPYRNLHGAEVCFRDCLGRQHVVLQSHFYSILEPRSWRSEPNGSRLPPGLQDVEPFDQRCERLFKDDESVQTADDLDSTSPYYRALVSEGV